MSIYICRYKWSTKYLWVQMEYKIRLLFVGQISLFYGYKYENRNSRTFVLQTEHLFYAKLYTINRMECICRHKFFGVQMEYKICKPFMGTINIMYSICRALCRYARNVTASPHFLDYCRRLSQTAKRETTGNPWAGFCGVVSLRPLVIS